MARQFWRFGFGGFLMILGLAACLTGAEPRDETKPVRWRQHDVRRPHPPVVEPAHGSIAAAAPRDAVVLFDGSSLDAWQASGGKPAKWPVKDGYFETAPGKGAIETKAKFGDIQLHLEWAAPDPPHGKGQDRGNSGVFLMDRFEIQVLDSYNADTYADGQAGAIYGQYPPIANASRPPGQWQTYDIAFRRPRFDTAGKLREPARITLFHNGILVQNNEEPFGPTSWLKWLPYKNDGARGPLSLQDHSHPVRYRNIWVRELSERAEPTADRGRPPTIALPAPTLDRFVGKYDLKPQRGDKKVSIERDGDHLVVTFPFRPQPLDLEAISETEFDMPTTDGRFTFQRNAEGDVTGAKFRIGDGERTLTKVKP